MAIKSTVDKAVREKFSAYSKAETDKEKENALTSLLLTLLDEGCNKTVYRYRYFDDVIGSLVFDTKTLQFGVIQSEASEFKINVKVISENFEVSGTTAVWVKSKCRVVDFLEEGK